MHVVFEVAFVEVVEMRGAVADGNRLTPCLLVGVGPLFLLHHLPRLLEQRHQAEIVGGNDAGKVEGETMDSFAAVVAAGCSMGVICPDPGITVKVEPFMASAICSDSAGGVTVS